MTSCVRELKKSIQTVYVEQIRLHKHAMNAHRFDTWQKKSEGDQKRKSAHTLHQQRVQSVQKMRRKKTQMPKDTKIDEVLM